MAMVPHTRPEQIAATIDDSIQQLLLVDSEGEHAARCEGLKAALVRLSDQLKQFRVSDQDRSRGIQLLVSTRISASITFSVAHKLANDPERVTCCCFKLGPDQLTAQALDRQRDSTLTQLRLLGDYAFQTFSQTFATVDPIQEMQGSGPGPPVDRSGVCTLSFTTPKGVDDKLVNRDVLSFAIADASTKVIYTVTTRLNNLAAWRGTAKRLAASIEIEQVDGCGKKTMDIRPPEKKEPAHLDQTAFLSVSGSQQAVVKSSPPDDTRINCFGLPMVMAATLLNRDHIVLRPDHTSHEHHGIVREYISQVYNIHVGLSITGFDIGLKGGALQGFRLQGEKTEFQVSYVCFVEETNEFLAIYQHDRRGHLGVIQFIGVGNYPALRDLIMGAFVAMGLHSEL